MALKDLQPAIDRFADYRPSHFPRDAIAGVLVALLLVPQAIAYASLAGLPPAVGLYAAILPTAIYALFGTSRALSVGPVALVSLLAADAVARSDAAPEAAALAMAAICGVLLIVLGLFGLGKLVNFISDAVMIGFTAGAAILIATSQAGPFLAIDASRGSTLFEALPALWRAADTVAVSGAVLGVASLCVFVGTSVAGGAWLDRFDDPGRLRIALVKSVPLAIIALAIAASAAFDFETALGIEIVGSSDVGFPMPSLPPPDAGIYVSLLPDAVATTIVLFVTAAAVAKSLAGRRRIQIDTDREALAIGVANLSASVSGGYPVGASISRSALNADAGARTPVSSVVTALIVLGACLVLAPVLHYLPKPVLAALVISAVFSLIRPREIAELWRYDWIEGGLVIVTFVLVLGLGVTLGLLIATMLGVLDFLWRGSEPRIVVEGPRDGGDGYRSEARKDVESGGDDVVVLRIDRSLFFANTDVFERHMLNLLAENDRITGLVLDMRAVNAVDGTAYRMIGRLLRRLNDRDVPLAFAETHRPVQVLLTAAFRRDGIDYDGFYATCDDAVEALEGST